MRANLTLSLIFRFVILVTAFVAGGACLGPVPALAQDGSAKGDDLTVFMGSFLPNQVNGVSEILPVFGGRYGLGTTFGTVEAGVANSHAEGVDFTVFEANLRTDFPAAEGLTGLAYGGMDYSWYIPNGSTNRESDFGFHIGGGALMDISDALCIRAEMKLMAGPGTSLSLLFGVLYKFSGGGT